MCASIGSSVTKENSVAIYVDRLIQWGNARWCHMMSDTSLGELHAMAQRIGLRREWFQDNAHHPHYDLTPNKRQAAIRAGAIPVSSGEMIERCIRGKERHG